MTDLCVFLRDLSGGGAERVMLTLAEGFARRGRRVDLVLVRAEGAYLAEVSEPVHCVSFNARRLSLSLLQLVAYLRKQRPPVLLSALQDTNFIAILAGIIARSNTRILVTVHCHISKDARHAGGFKRKLAPWLARCLYPLADRVIAVADNVADDLLALGIPPGKLVRIYNPIITPELLAQQSEPLQHPWFVDANAPVIVGMGRLHAEKHFDDLIQAFAGVLKQREARLIILGEGDARAALEARVQTLGLAHAVSMPGFVPNPQPYLKAARVFVLSSRWEAFGNVLVEAMAVGTPVIATACGGPEEILEGGQLGCLVPVHDVQAMTQAILRVLDAPETQCQDLRARAHDFGLDRALDQYEAVFKGIAHGYNLQ